MAWSVPGLQTWKGSWGYQWPRAFNWCSPGPRTQPGWILDISGKVLRFSKGQRGSWLVYHFMGHKHGRVLEVTSPSRAIALKLSQARSWISAVRFSLGTQAAESLWDREHRDTILKLFYILLVGIFLQVLWVSIVTLMISLKRRQKTLQRRELAESIEDAKIFASSRQLDHTQNIMMQPLDQVRYV